MAAEIGKGNRELQCPAPIMAFSLGDGIARIQETLVAVAGIVNAAIQIGDQVERAFRRVCRIDHELQAVIVIDRLVMLVKILGGLVAASALRRKGYDVQELEGSYLGYVDHQNKN